AGLTLWGVQNSWRRINELENRLTAAHLDSFRLADDFQHRLLNLNNSMLRFAARRENMTWTEFEQASKLLDLWIDEQEPKLNTELDQLRAFLFGGVVLSLALVAGLGWVIYRDMIAPLRTKLVQSEALLERQEKLATLGTLAAGIAHEIRNPLTSIKARLYTLCKHIHGNEAGTDDAGVISSEITRLERIVQDVLQFARPSDPQLELTPADVPLREVHALMAG